MLGISSIPSRSSIFSRSFKQYEVSRCLTAEGLTLLTNVEYFCPSHIHQFQLFRVQVNINGLSLQNELLVNHSFNFTRHSITLCLKHSCLMTCSGRWLLTKLLLMHIRIVEYLLFIVHYLLEEMLVMQLFQEFIAHVCLPLCSSSRCFYCGCEDETHCTVRC